MLEPVTGDLWLWDLQLVVVRQTAQTKAPESAKETEEAKEGDATEANRDNSRKFGEDEKKTGSEMTRKLATDANEKIILPQKH